MAQTDLFAPAHTRSQNKRRTGVVRTLRLARLLDLWRSRQALARLDATALEDIGLSSKQAKTEASRPIWDVPENWIR